MYRPNLQSAALAVPEIIVIAVLGWVVNPQSWGSRGRRGSGMAPFERALVTSYRLFIVTFPLSTRFKDIAAFVFQHATPSLISLKFPHVPLGAGGWPLGYEERRCWSN